MLIQPVSDVHTEFHRDGGKDFFESLPVEGDVLVMAGDIGHAGNLGPVFERVSRRWKDVVYVAGNHEAYGTGIVESREVLLKTVKPFSNVHFLNNDFVTIDEIKFFGGTGWFPKCPPSAQMNDFNMISDMDPEAYRLNQEFQVNYRRLESDADVIVTHHLPSMQCVTQRWKHSTLNKYFVSGFAPEHSGAALWVYGHTHDSNDFMLGSTRMVCNPFGYVTEDQSQFFNPYLRLEV